MALRPASAAAGPFADFAGVWSGTGTLRPQNDAAERIRCNANYRLRGNSGREVDLQVRCATDSYNFDLSGEFAADENNRVTGHWTEHTRSAGGTAIGTTSGDRLELRIAGAGFAAEAVEAVMVTRNRQQSVSIHWRGSREAIEASITLTRS